MLALILLRLTLQDVIADIPRDAGAIVTYALLGLLVAFVVIGSRKSGGTPPSGGRDHVQ